MTNAMQIDTIDVSLYKQYISGEISLRDAAKSFCSSGWSNFVDLEFTKRVFERVSKQID